MSSHKGTISSILCQFAGVLAGDEGQDKRVCDGLGGFGLLLQRLLQSSLSLFRPSEVKLTNCL